MKLVLSFILENTEAAAGKYHSGSGGNGDYNWYYLLVFEKMVTAGVVPYAICVQKSKNAQVA